MKELKAAGKTTGRGPELNGLLLLRKETGRTSFDALRPVKKALKGVKAGHTGTLDKFADGLLLVPLGRALKLVPWFSLCDKEYTALVKFGTETDTLDPEGNIIAEAEVPAREKIEKTIPRFLGEITQAPPAYSAVHINGKRAYELVRAGESPEMKKRPVTIHSIELEDWSPPFASIRVRCSSGTYIRSLARDLALACGSRAYLASLCRTRIGGFFLEDAFRFETGKEDGAEITEAETAALLNAVLPMSPDIFKRIGIPVLFIGAEEEKTIIHGKPLKFLEEKLFAACGGGAEAALFSPEDNGLIAVLQKKENVWHYGHVFRFS